MIFTIGAFESVLRMYRIQKTRKFYQHMKYTKILGTGIGIPPKIVSNDDLAEILNTSDEWITKRTGIKTRHFVEKGTGPSDLALTASRQALKNAKIDKDEIDFIIFATLSPDYYFPGSGVLLQDKLGAREVGALDIREQCGGFIYGMSIADQYIRTGMYKKILVVGAEVHSASLDYSPKSRDTTVLFGDGAGAALLGAADEPGVFSTHLHSQGKFFKALWMEAPASKSGPATSKTNLPEESLFPQMDGRTVFKNAIPRFVQVIDEALEANEKTIADVDVFIFHQANLRIIEAVGRRMKIPPEKVFNNIEKYGNTTSATVIIALHEALDQGFIKPGNLVCLSAFGSGFVWGSVLIRM